MTVSDWLLHAKEGGATAGLDEAYLQLRGVLLQRLAQAVQVTVLLAV
ncbi:hypothetical protein [Actinomadura kijaniata]|nr:hypothetical protein [Actinomadura kijaniata]